MSLFEATSTAGENRMKKTVMQTVKEVEKTAKG